MYLRMVRGLTRTAFAATSVVTHPDSLDRSASSGRERPRVWSSPTIGKSRLSWAGPKALRRPPQPLKARAPQPFWRQFFLVELSGARWVPPATGHIARLPKGRMRSEHVLRRLLRLL